jgi:hypothetical protein
VAEVWPGLSLLARLFGYHLKAENAQRRKGAWRLRALYALNSELRKDSQAGTQRWIIKERRKILNLGAPSFSACSHRNSSLKRCNAINWGKTV